MKINIEYLKSTCAVHVQVLQCCLLEAGPGGTTTHSEAGGRLSVRLRYIHELYGQGEEDVVRV